LNFIINYDMLSSNTNDRLVMTDGRPASSLSILSDQPAVEDQQALYSINTPPKILIQIEDIEAQIE